MSTCQHPVSRCVLFRMISQQTFVRLARFATVGVLVTVVFMGLNWLFGRWLGAQGAYLLAYPLAVALHYTLNRVWTFGCQRTDRGRQVSEYVIVSAATAVLQWALFTLLVTWTPLPAWLASGVASVSLTLLSYVVMSRRVFSPGKVNP
jgi:putative flippase GtrA